MRHTILIVMVSWVAVGCGGKPSAANIALRKQNQELNERIAQLEKTHAADQATIRAVEESKGTLQAIPATQLNRLFTTHGIELKRLTGAADFDTTRPGDDGIKVYVVPTDDAGEPIKSAGTIVVEAFDLALADQQRIGRWDFSAERARELWYGKFMQYEYVLTCPWQTAPSHGELTLKVTFTDLLTRRKFEEQKVIGRK